MLAVANQCIEIAKGAGAKDAGARAYRVRDVSLDWRDGKIERISESTTRGVMLQLYVDGRYSSHSTTDLRPERLQHFIKEAVALTRALQPDPHRKIPDPALFKDRPTADLASRR